MNHCEVYGWFYKFRFFKTRCKGEVKRVQNTVVCEKHFAECVRFRVFGGK